MFAVRLPQSDPHLFAGIDHASADPRLVGQDVCFHMEPGVWADELFVSFACSFHDAV